MHKLNRVLLPSFFVSIVLVGDLNPVLSQTFQQFSKERVGFLSFKKETQVGSENKSIVQRIIDLFKRKPRTSGNFSGFCGISPDPTNPLVRTSWNLQPIFVWRGNVTKVRVSDRETGDILWPKPSTGQDWHVLSTDGGGQEYIMYDGEPLKEGGRYRLELLYSSHNNPEAEITEDIKFEILSSGERELIKSEFELEIERRLAETDLPILLTEIEIAQEEALIRAEVFEEHDLWMDVISEGLSINTSVEETNEKLEELQRMCD